MSTTDVVAGAIEGVKGLDLNLVAFAILLYLLLLWLSVAIWIARDAHRRYDELRTAIIWAALVFVFNFPAMMFYFIARPDDGDEQGHGTTLGGGVSVPLAEFKGESGQVALTFQLQINPSELTAALAAGQKSPDLKVEMEWLRGVPASSSSNTTEQLVDKAGKVEAEASQLKKLLQRLGNRKTVIVEGLGTRVRTAFKKSERGGKKVEQSSKPDETSVLVETATPELVE